MQEWNDIYDEYRNCTGRVHLRGTPWKPGEYGLTVCVGLRWLRSLSPHPPGQREKASRGTWENTGGAAQAGETSRQAIARELFEETGIRAEESEFEFLGSDRDKCTFYDFYCLKRRISLKRIVLLPGETDAVMWAGYGKIHWMIRTKKICRIIASQFRRQESELKKRNLSK